MKHLLDKVNIHIPGTTPKPLSEEFPLCHETGLILDYKFETGPTVTAAQVEKIIGELKCQIFDLERDLREIQDR